MKQELKQRKKKEKQKKEYASKYVKSKDVDIVVKELKDIQNAQGLTPENVVERARNVNNPLHRYFTWDNTKAGDKWRKWEARFLIRSIRVTISEREVQAFESVKVNVTEGNNGVEMGREYVDVVTIFNDKELKSQLINSALAEARYWAEKYKSLSELNPVFKAIDEVEGGIDIDGEN